MSLNAKSSLQDSCLAYSDFVDVPCCWKCSRFLKMGHQACKGCIGSIRGRCNRLKEGQRHVVSIQFLRRLGMAPYKTKAGSFKAGPCEVRYAKTRTLQARAGTLSALMVNHVELAEIGAWANSPNEISFTSLGLDSSHESPQSNPAALRGQFPLRSGPQMRLQELTERERRVMLNRYLNEPDRTQITIHEWIFGIANLAQIV